MNVKRARRVLANCREHPAAHGEKNTRWLMLWSGNPQAPSQTVFVTSGAPAHLRRLPDGITGTYAAWVAVTFAPKDTRLTSTQVTEPYEDPVTYLDYASKVLGLGRTAAQRLLLDCGDLDQIEELIDQYARPNGTS